MGHGSSDPYYKLPRPHSAAEKTNHGIHGMDTNQYLAQSSRRSRRLWSLSKKKLRGRKRTSRELKRFAPYSTRLEEVEVESPSPTKEWASSGLVEVESPSRTAEWASPIVFSSTFDFDYTYNYYLQPQLLPTFDFNSRLRLIPTFCYALCIIALIGSVVI